MRSKIAIDIGTSYTKIYKKNNDVVLYEPTMIAISNNNYKKPIAYGFDAEQLIGKTTENVKIISPVNNTEITDEKALTALLLHFIKLIKTKFEKMPNVVFSVQCGANREIIKNFEMVFNNIGIYNVEYCESPVLSLLGLNANINETKSGMIIDFGGGQTTICALTLGGVISGLSVELGGNSLNSEIITHLENTINLSISNSQAEELKKNIGGLVSGDETKTVVIGKDTLTGKNHSTQINASQIELPIKIFIDKIINFVHIILKKLPNESIKDIENGGIYLTGGGSKLFGLSDYLTMALNYKTIIDDESEIATILGGGVVVENKAILNKIKLKI